MFKRDGINHREVNLVIDGDPYTAVVLTCLNTDHNQTKDYGEKFYDIVSIEKQAKHSAMNGTFVTKATPHKIRFADGSPDMLTVAQKQRVVNRGDSTYSSGADSGKTAIAAAFANAKKLKSDRNTSDTDYRFSVDDVDEEEIAERQAKGTDKIAPTQQELERERQAWLQKEYNDKQKKSENKPVIAKQRLVKNLSIHSPFPLSPETRSKP